MEYADILHVLWIGVARDLTGSLLMEVAEKHSFDQSPSYDSRFRIIHGSLTRWCQKNGIRPSTVELFSFLVASRPFQSCSLSHLRLWSQFLLVFLHSSLSLSCLSQWGLQKLGVDALSYDYPLGPSKAYANRVVFPGVVNCGNRVVDAHLWSVKFHRIGSRLAFLADYIFKVLRLESICINLFRDVVHWKESNYSALESICSTKNFEMDVCYYLFSCWLNSWTCCNFHPGYSHIWWFHMISGDFESRSTCSRCPCLVHHQIWSSAGSGVALVDRGWSPCLCLCPKFFSLLENANSCRLHFQRVRFFTSKACSMQIFSSGCTCNVQRRLSTRGGHCTN